MQISITKGVKTIRLTKGERNTLANARDLARELELACPCEDAEKAHLGLDWLLEGIDEKGVFSPVTEDSPT